LSLPFVLAPLVVFLALILFLLPVLVRLFKQCHLDDVTPEWLESFSPVTYRPMELLLAEEDFNFLLRQPGFESAIGKKLRKDRVKIFRQYLHRLISDFNRLHVYARFLIARSQDDQSAVLARVVWLRLRFSVTVSRLELSLFLAYFGFRPRLVSQAIAQLDEMSSCLYSLSPA
jgi:hypothetical protein